MKMEHHPHCHLHLGLGRCKCTDSPILSPFFPPSAAMWTPRSCVVGAPRVNGCGVGKDARREERKGPTKLDKRAFEGGKKGRRGQGEHKNGDRRCRNFPKAMLSAFTFPLVPFIGPLCLHPPTNTLSHPSQFRAIMWPFLSSQCKNRVQMCPDHPLPSPPSPRLLCGPHGRL